MFFEAIAALTPANTPVDQAICKLNPPVKASTSKTSPAKNKFLTNLLWHVFGSTSFTSTPPEVTIPTFILSNDLIEKSNFFTNSSKLDNGQVGVRLKVAFDEIKDEIIKEELSDCPYVVQVENGVKVLLALEWPQEFITEKQDINNLNILYKIVDKGNIA